MAEWSDEERAKFEGILKRSGARVEAHRGRTRMNENAARFVQSFAGDVFSRPTGDLPTGAKSLVGAALLSTLAEG